MDKRYINLTFDGKASVGKAELVYTDKDGVTPVKLNSKEFLQKIAENI